DLSMAVADDCRPARHHARLNESEAAKRGAAYLRHEFGDRLGRTAARPFISARLGGLLRLVLAFHHGDSHAIAARWWIGSRLRCSMGTTGMRASCRGGRAPGMHRHIG